ncbi:MAG: RNA polymerase sigma factor, partial [Candidatus Falkowbacteria bacterium]|nr:RNA polymerase sigma factor [Candidatus Falkowbacteria bacterium]
KFFRIINIRTKTMIIPTDNINAKSDNELVALALADKGYFLYLLRRYEDKLKRYIYRISNFSNEEVEDVLQEVFLKVYKNLNDFDSDLKFSSWIYRITHNQVVSHHRQSLARPKVVEIDEIVIEKIKDEFNVDDKIQLDYLRREISQILDYLKPKYREILILRFFEEKSYEEISDILKKPSGTVATLIHEAKKEFKNYWLKNK